MKASTAPPATMRRLCSSRMQPMVRMPSIRSRSPVVLSGRLWVPLLVCFDSDMRCSFGSEEGRGRRGLAAARPALRTPIRPHLPLFLKSRSGFLVEDLIPPSSKLGGVLGDDPRASHVSPGDHAEGHLGEGLADGQEVLAADAALGVALPLGVA